MLSHRVRWTNISPPPAPFLRFRRLLSKTTRRPRGFLRQQGPRPRRMPSPSRTRTIRTRSTLGSATTFPTMAAFSDSTSSASRSAAARTPTAPIGPTSPTPRSSSWQRHRPAWSSTSSTAAAPCPPRDVTITTPGTATPALGSSGRPWKTLPSSRRGVPSTKIWCCCTSFGEGRGSPIASASERAGNATELPRQMACTMRARTNQRPSAAVLPGADERITVSIITVVPSTPEAKRVPLSKR
mmetsp:Transcript_11928/g.28290  ORF Transcript_11928/g.28290 Transcript_11928/m.28290 type:complete len:241 (-) Transcript_11928:1854-2576(-)